MLNVILLMLAVALVGFSLGSIPWGVVISRLFYKTDLRQHGSGNIGTTNALRTLGKRGGALVFLLDFGKGLLAGWVGAWLGKLSDLAWLSTLSDTALATAAYNRIYGLSVAMALLACVLGHIFSPWLDFRGGKGIAVAIGCLFFTFGWPGALIELGVFVLVVALSRYVSLGSIAAAVACPLVAVWVFVFNHSPRVDSPWAILPCLLTAVVVIWAHRGNIVRLRAGTENRLGSKKAAEKAE